MGHWCIIVEDAKGKPQKVYGYFATDEEVYAIWDDISNLHPDNWTISIARITPVAQRVSVGEH